MSSEELFIVHLIVELFFLFALQPLHLFILLRIAFLILFAVLIGGGVIVVIVLVVDHLLSLWRLDLFILHGSILLET